MDVRTIPNGCGGQPRIAPPVNRMRLHSESDRKIHQIRKNFEKNDSRVGEFKDARRIKTFAILANALKDHNLCIAQLHDGRTVMMTRRLGSPPQKHNVSLSSFRALGREYLCMHLLPIRTEPRAVVMSRAKKVLDSESRQLRQRHKVSFCGPHFAFRNRQLQILDC